jgi:hypothetical protein
MRRARREQDRKKTREEIEPIAEIVVDSMLVAQCIIVENKSVQAMPPAYEAHAPSISPLS